MPKGVRLGGRQKGTPNKITATLKEAILQAAQEAHQEGLVGYLKKQALEQPAAFMTLLGKTLPPAIPQPEDGDEPAASVTIHVSAPVGDVRVTRSDA